MTGSRKPPTRPGHLRAAPSPSNGAGARPPTEEELTALQAQAQQEVAAMLAGMVEAFSSAAPPAAQLVSTAVATLHQQEALGQVIDDATHPDKRKAHPEWGVKLKHRQTGAQGVIRVPKDFGACKTIEEALHHATIVALLTNPTPRVLLFAHGFDVEFFQAPASTPQPKITLT